MHIKFTYIHHREPIIYTDTLSKSYKYSSLSVTKYMTAVLEI